MLKLVDEALQTILINKICTCVGLSLEHTRSTIFLEPQILRVDTYLGENLMSTWLDEAAAL